MSRYKESRKATNKDDMYKDVLDRKGVRSITQYRVRRMKQVDENTKQRIRFDQYIWKYGDTYQMLASRYYSDPKMWWVIASFNNKPTESHLEIGDTIKIPLNISEAMQVI